MVYNKFAKNCKRTVIVQLIVKDLFTFFGTQHTTL